MGSLCKMFLLMVVENMVNVCTKELDIAEIELTKVQFQAISWDIAM